MLFSFTPTQIGIPSMHILSGIDRDCIISDVVESDASPRKMQNLLPYTLAPFEYDEPSTIPNPFLLLPSCGVALSPILPLVLLRRNFSGKHRLGKTRKRRAVIFQP